MSSVAFSVGCESQPGEFILSPKFFGVVDVSGERWRIFRQLILEFLGVVLPVIVADETLNALVIPIQNVSLFEYNLCKG